MLKRFWPVNECDRAHDDVRRHVETQVATIEAQLAANVRAALISLDKKIAEEEEARTRSLALLRAYLEMRRNEEACSGHPRITRLGKQLASCMDALGTKAPNGEHGRTAA